MNGKPSPRPVVLAVCTDPKIRAQLETMVSDWADISFVEAGDAASTIAGSLPCAMLIDQASSADGGFRLAREYLQRCDHGRVAFLSRLDDRDTQMRLLVGEGRTEVIFEPWTKDDLKLGVLGPLALV